MGKSDFFTMFPTSSPSEKSRERDEKWPFATSVPLLFHFCSNLCSRGEREKSETRRRREDGVKTGGENFCSRREEGVRTCVPTSVPTCVPDEREKRESREGEEKEEW